MRQLYHLGVIEAYSGATKKKEGETVSGPELCGTCGRRPSVSLVFCVQLEVFQVNVAPDLQQQLAGVVQELGVHIPPPVSDSN